MLSTYAPTAPYPKPHYNRQFCHTPPHLVVLPLGSEEGSRRIHHTTHTNQRDKHQATPPLNILPYTEHTGFTEKFLDKRKDRQLHEQKWESANSVNSV